MGQLQHAMRTFIQSKHSLPTRATRIPHCLEMHALHDQSGKPNPVFAGESLIKEAGR